MSSRYDHVRSKNEPITESVGPAIGQIFKPASANKNALESFGPALGQSSKSAVNENHKLSYARTVASSSAATSSTTPWNRTSLPLNDFSEMSDQLSSLETMSPDQIPLCPYYEMGFCVNGDECQFIHGRINSICF